MEYLTPRDGRPYPDDARANNLFHWQTTLIVPNAEAMTQRLRAGNARFISPAVALHNAALGFKKEFLVRDPDGHVVER